MYKNTTNNMVKQLIAIIIVLFIGFIDIPYHVKAESGGVLPVVSTVHSITYDDCQLYNMPDVVKDAVFNEKNKPIALSEDGADNLNSVTVVNEDGTNTLHIFPYDIKYIENDKVKFISDVISKTSDKEYEYQNNDGDISRKFSTDFETGVELKYKNNKVKLAPLYENEGLVKCIESQDGIMYNNIYSDNISVKYTSALNGIKEDIILEKNEGINTFKFLLNTGGLEPETMSVEKDAIPLIDPDTGEVCMIIGQIYAYDSAYDESTGKGKHRRLSF